MISVSCINSTGAYQSDTALNIYLRWFGTSVHTYIYLDRYIDFKGNISRRLTCGRRTSFISLRIVVWTSPPGLVWLADMPFKPVISKNTEDCCTVRWFSIRDITAPGALDAAMGLGHACRPDTEPNRPVQVKSSIGISPSVSFPPTLAESRQRLFRGESRSSGGYD